MLENKFNIGNASFILKFNRVKDIYEAELFMLNKNEEIHKKEGKLKIHHFTKNELDMCMGDATPYIGQQITVKCDLTTKEIRGISEEGADIFTVGPVESIFDKGTVLDLTQGKDKKKAYLHFKSCIIGTFEMAELPDNLFLKRIEYKAVVLKDDIVRIVRYCSIHTHTEYSLFDGNIRIPDLVKKTEYACAITDHGDMSGFLEFYKAMKAANKLPIIGFEAYIETKMDRSGDTLDESPVLRGEHMILLAKNKVGLENLFYLTSNAYTNFYKKPHITFEMLEAHCEGVIATSACIAGTLSKCVAGKMVALENETVQQIVSINSEEEMLSVVEADIVKYPEDVKLLIRKYVSSLKIEKNYIETMTRLFKDDFYVEIQNHSFEYETMIMNKVKEIAKKYNLKTVVGIDAHYLNAEDAEAHEVWLCLQSKKTMSDPTRLTFDGDGYYVQNSDEVLDRFPDDLDAIDNTLEIMDKCNCDDLITFKDYHLPVYQIPEGFKDQAEYFKHICRVNFIKTYKGTNKVISPVYLERMKFELDTILNMGWAGYFLIVEDYIRWAKDDKVRENYKTYFPNKDISEIPEYLLKEHKILVGRGRGSGAGSLVNHILGITDCDPIEYGLLFERFLNPDRISMPDIDTDFEDVYRNEVIEYVKFKYGEDKVSRIVTFGSAAAKAVILDVGRVYEYDLSFVRKITKLIPKQPGIKIKNALSESPELKKMYDTDVDVKKIINVAMKFEGLKKHKSVHACGVIISDKPVYKYMPQCLIRKSDGIPQWTSQITMNECEELGCLKADFLGLRNLSIVHNVLDMVNYRKLKGKELEFEKIPMFDLDTYQSWRYAQTDAVFQFESKSMKNIIQNVLQGLNSIDTSTLNSKEKKKLAKKCFAHACDATALGRPGPMAEIPHYVENMLAPAKIHYESENMKSILNETNGIIVYQEQMMSIVRALAGFTPGQADNVRKAMSKKLQDKLLENGNYFVYGSPEKNITGCIANGISESDAKAIWKRMEDFGKYAFNKSHSVAYTMLSAQTGYLAYHYSTYFFAAVLNSFLKKNDKLIKNLSVVRKKNIAILPPDINLSRKKFLVEEDAEFPSIRFGMEGIKRVGAVAGIIVDERDANGPFTSFYDFLFRVTLRGKGINKMAIEALIYSGALDCFGTGLRRSMIISMDSITKVIADIRKNENVQIFKYLPVEWQEFKKSSVGQLIGKIDEFDPSYILIKEHEYSGFYISGHPLNGYEGFLNTYGIVSTERFAAFVPEAKEIDELGEKNSDDITIAPNFDPVVVNVDEVYDELENDEEVFEKMYCHMAGVVTDLEILYTSKDNSPMAKFTLEDRDGQISCICFPKNYEKIQSILVENAVVLLEGYVDNNEDFGIQMQVNKLMDLATLVKPMRITSIRCKAFGTIEDSRKQYLAIKKLVDAAPKGDVKIEFKLDKNSVYDITGDKSIDIDDQFLSTLDIVMGEKNRSVIYSE